MPDENKTEATTTRYGVYDETLEQYVGETHDRKGDATDAASEARKQPRHKGHKLTVRDV